MFNLKYWLLYWLLNVYNLTLCRLCPNLSRWQLRSEVFKVFGKYSLVGGPFFYESTGRPEGTCGFDIFSMLKNLSRMNLLKATLKSYYTMVI